MKKILIGLLSFVALSSASAKSTSGTGQIGSGTVSLTEKDFAGSYIVGRLAIEGPYYVVQFEVSKKGDVVVFRQANMDQVSENNDCIGDGFKIDGDILNVGVACKSLGGAVLNFEINVAGLTKADLEKGASVMVRSEATEGAWIPFEITKRKKSFF
ncbi:hypothetical protein AB1A81_00335 [Bdellovibrio bacteriovorus]|uniref:Uncharacterized protein n=1 Tax=Bdellovibrio bacteriovorus (strain ATCC 15356 / DSM 50701 / NCIMB 9529 / HD100) TaxID=264462 RepID=Q6MRI9_BDEBA|nr:hypothetical protein [Bdellovibrio bacteriovorus]AHZ85745.1 hypothetical protein EP01_12470 [Bdellovibrio bacteriovorus]BEV66664.1 hypothetical protein Bb109J_c0084 [Bdellovibrio bacteriovorus]CAE77769.1 hypothetical protein predicted by Glimmer/Critica [Bdellovibrio bacteriovorus HD100]